MVGNEPWAAPHGDLAAARALVYEPGGFRCSVPVSEPESAEYAACVFTLDDRSVRFRVGKTTPTKAGQFVTVWQRSAEGPIRPFDADDGVDLFVVSSRDGNGFGQFVFPCEALCERGVVSRDGSRGKRGFRVYPPWVTTASRQARGTQAWQARYFLDLGGEGLAPDLARARALYHA
ncbi:MepB family protein [Streptomyces alkaliterrae]|uniref:MepB domain containing protein n=1 Tax=Streptomyces alkaliterrae TaxID=2213162 RepID=A0A5P0YZL9_9ACTN|nr:MepB family protein [Streptomyces alkaliterrae]MBB1261411.1 MepB family protein [Streptomyces alkaliterrae]MQS05147.1 MepB domain containing protein [Streptomyces alkaliterrae]